jgi:hypothetical protein
MSLHDIATHMTPLGRLAGFVGLLAGLVVLVRRSRERNVRRGAEADAAQPGIRSSGRLREAAASAPDPVPESAPAPALRRLQPDEDEDQRS